MCVGGASLHWLKHFWSLGGVLKSFRGVLRFGGHLEFGGAKVLDWCSLEFALLEALLEPWRSVEEPKRSLEELWRSFGGALRISRQFGVWRCTSLDWCSLEVF